MSTITKQWLQQKIADMEATRDEIPFGLDEDDSNTLAAMKLALASLEAEAAYFINRVKHSDAYGDNVELRTYCYELDALKSKDDFGGEIVPVYTAPPAPTVPDKITSANAPEVFEIAAEAERLGLRGAYASYAVGWNACRAAMLQGAEPVTTAYKLPANTPCKEAPEHIWLQTAGVWPENGEFSELTWCIDNQHPDDTLYVRADVVPGNSQVIPDGWVACSERMPEEGGRYWCYVEEQNDLGKSHYQWNCAWNGSRWWVEHEDGGRVTHWMPLPATPQQEVKL
ncbi:DUF551 domain-containing protein [Enterobacter roggenkampii]|uniref:DUF551 domain-containing protein n=1 Tax=Enterobacter roggenkampii TaxID=1812935 RepID=UPI0032AE8AD9